MFDWDALRKNTPLRLSLPYNSMQRTTHAAQLQNVVKI